MSAHLTDEQLQAYLFRLDDGVAGEHLKACSSCTRRLEALGNQFASLDLLKDNPAASQTLVAETLDQIQGSGRGTRHLPWAWAALFLLAAGLCWWVVQRPDGQVALPEIVQERSEHAEPPLARIVPPEVIAALRETKPFVPGSNIELNVLPRRDNVQLSIYNKADLTLVRDTRQLTLKKGWNWLQFMWANTLIDPTSLRLEPSAFKDRVEVQQLVFPPRMQGVGRWLIFSEVSGRVPFEITYFTSGISWRAFYMATLSPDEQSMRLQGYVRVDNQSGEDYEQAQTRLIVGKVHVLDRIADLAKRPHAYGSPIQVPENPQEMEAGFAIAERPGVSPLSYAFANMDGGMLGAKVIAKEGLSEYFLYTIEGRETIPNTWAKRLPSFDVTDVPVTSLYKYHDEQYGSKTMHYLRFTNGEKDHLGETPLPDGQIKVYHQLDAAGKLSYVGGAPMLYIPVEEEADILLGDARQVSVEPVLMDQKQANYVFDTAGNVAGWDTIEQWEIRLTNARRIPARVEAIRFTGGAHWTLKMEADRTVEYEKEDLSHVRFETTLKPGEKKTIRYLQTSFNGEREHQR